NSEKAPKGNDEEVLQEKNTDHLASERRGQRFAFLRRSESLQASLPSETTALACRTRAATYLSRPEDKTCGLGPGRLTDSSRHKKDERQKAGPCLACRASANRSPYLRVRSTPNPPHQQPPPLGGVSLLGKKQPRGSSRSSWVLRAAFPANGKRRGRSDSRPADRRQPSPPAGASWPCSCWANRQHGWGVKGRSKRGKRAPNQSLASWSDRSNGLWPSERGAQGASPLGPIGGSPRRELFFAATEPSAAGGAETPRGGRGEEAGSQEPRLLSAGLRVLSRRFLGLEVGPSTPGGGGGGPVVPGSVQLALSILHALLYAALFAFAYLQLWRLLLYRERRLSYQSLCLFLCLLWAALRTTLFSAAFSLSGSLPLLRPPAHLHFFPHWLLYCFPSCLQFSTLCLLNLYLAEVRREDQHAGPGGRAGPPSSTRAEDRLYVKSDVQLNLTNTISYICKITKMSSANVYLESKGMSLCQTVVVGSVVILLYSSRACYNLVVITISQDTLESPFNYGWDNLSDK
ncbi:hypothetical protein EI555_011670, partial [Monodon monoceros]